LRADSQGAVAAVGLSRGSGYLPADLRFPEFRRTVCSSYPLTLLDRSFLSTLDRRQMSNGLAEILKIALVKDRNMALTMVISEHRGLESARERAGDGGPQCVTG